MLTFTLLHDMPNLITLGLAVFALVQLIQRLPWPPAWAQRKPLSCPVCLSWWSSIIGGGWNASDNGLSVPLLAFWAGVAGLSIALEALVTYWRPMPPPLA